MRLRIIIKLFFPLCLFYIIYFLIIEKHIYKNADLFSIGAQETFSLASQDIKSNVDYLIVGDSSSLYAINPLQLSKHSISKATVGSSVYMAEKQLRSIDVNMVQKAILISQTFIDDHYDMDVWGLLVPNGIMDFNDVTFLLNDSPELAGRADITLRYYLSKLHLNYFAAAALMKWFKKPHFDFKKYREYLKRQLTTNQGHLGIDPNRKMSLENFLLPYKDHFNHAISPAISELNSLKKIVNLAEKHHLLVYFIKTPMADAQTNINIDSYKASVNKLLSQVTSSNFKIIDGWTFGQSLAIDSYLDFNHLNQKGADEFTKFLKLEILRLAVVERRD